MATVVLHITENGMELLASPDIDHVFWIDENIPNDRVYRSDLRSTLEEIGELIGDSSIGHTGDGRMTENKRQAIIAKLEPAIRLVPTATEEK